MSGKQLKPSKQSKVLYRDSLEPIERARYDSKLAIIGGISGDPYELKSFSEDVKLLPAVTYPDIVNYLVFTPSPYTTEDLKCYKGLEAYNQFICGWVSAMKTVIIDNKHVVKAKVLHSQRLREKSLNPWAVMETNGRILASHCDCMAGVGEVCSHVASVLFAVEGTVHIRDSRTVTQEPAYWLLPTSLKKVTYSETRYINFSSAKSLKKTFDNLCDNPLVTPASVKKEKKPVPVPTESEIADLFASLHATGRKPAILSIVPEYAEGYIPKVETMKYAKVLTELRDKTSISLNYMDLVNKCNDISVAVTEEEASNVEMSTRQQADSKLWFHFRAGRITASKMKAVCSTDSSNPSQSLIMAICYPSEHKFTSAATTWGIRNEKIALDKFVQAFKAEGHENVSVESCGFFISTDHPWIGATPDGIISCDCCGRSILEVKCPYTKKDALLEEDGSFYLKQGEDGELHLDKKHPYYYQIQTQLGVTKCESCYFIVWTEIDTHIEEISFQQDLWEEMVENSAVIFKTAILPEMVGKFYSRLPGTGIPTAPLKVHVACNSANSCENDMDSLDTSNEITWCYCDQVESGKMVFCDNENCDIKWFHFICLKMTCKPKSKLWYCPECRKLPQFSKKRVKVC